MLIAFTKNCIVSSVRLQFSHYFYWDPENISLVRDLATVLFQLLTMVDYQRKFNETAKKSTLQFVNLPSYMMLTMMGQKRANVESRRFTDGFFTRGHKLVDMNKTAKRKATWGLPQQYNYDTCWNSRRHGRKKCSLLFNLLEYRVTGVSWLDEEERSERSDSKGPFLLSSSRLSSPSSSPFAARLWWKLGREEKGRKQRPLSLLWFSPSSTPHPPIPRSDPLKSF